MRETAESASSAVCHARVKSLETKASEPRFSRPTRSSSLVALWRACNRPSAVRPCFTVPTAGALLITPSRLDSDWPWRSAKYRFLSLAGSGGVQHAA